METLVLILVVIFVSAAYCIPLITWSWGMAHVSATRPWLLLILWPVTILGIAMTVDDNGPNIYRIIPFGVIATAAVNRDQLGAVGVKLGRATFVLGDMCVGMGENRAPRLGIKRQCQRIGPNDHTHTQIAQHGRELEGPADHHSQHCG